MPRSTRNTHLNSNQLHGLGYEGTLLIQIYFPTSIEPARNFVRIQQPVFLLGFSKKKILTFKLGVINWVIKFMNEWMMDK